MCVHRWAGELLFLGGRGGGGEVLLSIHVACTNVQMHAIKVAT